MSSILRHKSVRIAKPTHGHHAKDGETVGPVETLIDRNNQFKHITKSLLHWAKGMSAIEATTAKALKANTETIQVPFHEGHAFLGEGGWQEALYAVRDHTKHLSELHQSLANTLDRTVIEELERVRSDLKAHIVAIEKDAGVLQTEVNKERVTSAQHLTTLQQGIDTFENSHHAMLPQNDPYVTHTHVHNQLTKQLHKENELQTALIRFQQQQPSFEAGISSSIQSAIRLYDEAKDATMKQVAEVDDKIKAVLQQVAPDAEYNHFATTEGHALDPNTPLRDLNAISFPGQNHAASKPLKEGLLERKKRFTKTYKEAYYVLTPSGYLHERKSNDDVNAVTPTFSLFLPECSLSAPSKVDSKSHKIHVEGNKAVKSKVEGKMKSSLRLGSKELAYSFRTRTHNDMLSWWEAIDQLSRDTKAPVTVTQSKTPVSPVAAAVANVGYADPSTATPVSTTGAGAAEEIEVARPAEPEEAEEEVEDDEDDEGGSSAEEEEYEIRTAPSTPAVLTSHKSSPLDNPESVHPASTSAFTESLASPVTSEKHTGTSEAQAEILPTYQGDGTTTAEHEAVQTEKKGLFASIFGGSSSPQSNAPVASTSNAPAS